MPAEQWLRRVSGKSVAIATRTILNRHEGGGQVPAALLALEKINRLNVPGLGRDTTMLIGVATDMQTAALTDATSPSGLPTIAHYIRKVLLVSDNDAFNRIYA